MATKNRRIFELRLGKLGLLLFVCGMSLLLFASFLLGIVVGKHMEAYPELYSSGLTELIRDRLPTAPRKATGQETAADKDEKFDLTFYETLGKEKGAAADSHGGEHSAKPAGGSEPQKSPPAAEPEKTQPPAKEAAGPGSAAASGEEGGRKKPTPLPAHPEGERPAVKPSGAPSPATAEAKRPIPAGERRFEIQAAAYREKRQAEQLVKKLATAGFSSHVVMKEIAGKGIWYRVIVPGFGSRDKAKEAAEQMAGKIRGLSCVIRAAENGGN